LSLIDYYKNAKTENFYWEVSRGRIPGVTPIIVQGQNDSVGTTQEVLTNLNADFSRFTGPSKVKISSSSNNDSAGGSGLRTLALYGLDVEGKWVFEVIALNGQTPVESLNTFTALWPCRGLTAGALGKNDGDVYVGTGTVTTGVPTNKHLLIKNDPAEVDNTALSSVVRVPLGYRMSILGVVTSSEKNEEVRAAIYARPPGGVFTSFGKVALASESIFVPLRILPTFSAGFDVEIRAVNKATGTMRVNATFTLVLERVTEEVPFIIPGLLNTSEEWIY
jgi:hypothetical protein